MDRHKFLEHFGENFVDQNFNLSFSVGVKNLGDRAQISLYLHQAPEGISSHEDAIRVYQGILEGFVNVPEEARYALMTQILGKLEVTLANCLGIMLEDGDIPAENGCCSDGGDCCGECGDDCNCREDEPLEDIPVELVPIVIDEPEN